MNISEFCSAHLVSLLDIEGIRYYLIPNTKSKGSTMYNVYDSDFHLLTITFDTIEWSNISFEVIPFLLLLEKYYELEINIMYYKVVDGDTRTFKSLVSIEDIEGLDDCYLRHLFINIK